MVFTISHNKLADYNRKAHLSHEVNVNELPEVVAENNTTDTFENPINWRVQKILEKLSADESEFLALRYEFEFTNSEIAAITNSTANAVRSRYCRLLEKYRRIANE